MSTPPPKRKKGGFFGCRSKHALDSLPRNARGDNAAIHRLQARDVFQHGPRASDSSTSTAAMTPLTEEKGLQKLAELNRTQTSLQPASPQFTAPVKPLYAQEVPEGEYAESTFGEQQHQYHDQNNETEEERDMFADEVLTPVYDRPSTPGAVRSLSVASRTGRIKRSLSLKRSGSTASAKLIARAPPVSSADFADLPASSSSSSDLTEKQGAGLGDMASIRKARGRHQFGGHRHLVPDISEDEYLALDNVPIPPARLAPDTQETDAPHAPLKNCALKLSMPESDSMRAVAAALEGSTDSVRFHPGPAVGTPKLEPPSPASDAYSAEIQSQLLRETSEDTVTDLPSNAPAAAGSASRGFWDAVPESEESFGPGRAIPFQYVTNMARPVSIASLRSLACPNTPPRTSSRPTSPDGTYHGLRSTKSFSVSPLKKQATFNGFPRTFFPGVSTLKHSPSTASNASARRKPVPDVMPALEFEQVHAERQKRRAQREQHLHREDDDEGDVERQLGDHTRSHTCSNCGVVEEQRDFAAFVAKGKASRRTSVKQQTIKTTAAGSLRKSRSVAKNDTVGEATLKRWGLAEAFQSAQAESLAADVPKVATVKKPKKMVPGPGGGYITDTANIRWCSALDEIKKALAVDAEHQRGPTEDEEEEAKVQRETQTALAEADAVLARLGVET
ncbi:hypothetical protein EX895_003836 [Sporisorium graminicola]|uniref:Uncharacterized protein n=1 Tax=Sporisorium graminicola TaxID=280036 RepID=A0A4V6ETM0_9BASI|nr:hypothetical protein EX895_003836 [Sporisorium graminicola]TKY87159.1 hypothetical protein EX895_003836 [Sporisorium graminicola]